MRQDNADFTAIPADGLRFLRSLARNNDREWFTANRERYERTLLQPLRALVEEMDVRLADFAPELTGSPRRSIFRIHRDIRFSNDKSPYKRHAAFLLYHRDVSAAGAAGRTMGAAGYYVHIQPGESFVGGGIYMPPPPVLRKLRDAIVNDPEELGRIVSDRAFKRRYGGLSEEGRLTRLPRGFQAHPATDSLLRHRSFTAWQMLDNDTVTSPSLPDELERAMRTLLPLVRWVNDILGFRAASHR
ncbi:MAG TPA: DUF2461 domain-containing protein [Gemmatimonadales bacterium]|nr:DUF2461 domain-containing protein [Gemmatimonadales bacterium]